MDQSLTHGYVSRFEHTALRSRLHTEGFSLTCPHRTPTQGTSTEDLGQYNKGVHNSSLNQIQPLTEAMHNQPKHHLTQEGLALSQQINHLTLEGFQHKLHLSLEGANQQSPPLTRGSQTIISTSHQREPNTTSTITSQQRDTKSITSHQRDITKMEVYNLVVSTTTNQIFSQIKRSYRQDRMIQLKCEKIKSLKTKTQRKILEKNNLYLIEMKNKANIPNLYFSLIFPTLENK